jgi:DNA-directed RNA polymerase specialized sigma24 family protein
MEGGAGAEPSDPQARPAPAGQTDLFGPAARVLQALADLDPEARAALELSVGRALSYERIAGLRAVPVSEVRDAARRGLLHVVERMHRGGS